MKKSVFTKIISFYLSLCILLLPISVNAQEFCADIGISVQEDRVSLQNDVPIYEDISEHIKELKNYSVNSMERTYSAEEFTITQLPDGLNAFAIQESQENTDPNYAYLVETENVKQGELAQAGEMRWYGCILDKTSKVSIMLQTVSTVDADIYVFQLDQNSNELNLIGGNATEGLGISEYYSAILNPGIYYFAISAYEGNGQYAFAFYATQDLINEINDNFDVATVLEDSCVIEGMIDNPFDQDIYTFTLTSAAILNITTNLGNYAKSFGKADSSGHIYKISNKNEIYQFSAGTYYLVIYSKNGTYGTDQTYNITFNKIADVADDPSASYYTVNEPAHIVFQTDPAGRNMYVNGNKIDISYKYYLDASNSYGTQVYDIVMENCESLRAKLYETQFQFEDWELTVAYGMVMPDTVYYHGGSMGADFVGNVLELSLYSDEEDFYKIHCMCSGSYAANRLYNDRSHVTVLIDPNTGKLVDIENFNYFYDYASGSHSMTYTRPHSYATKFYYPYANGEEPKIW